MRRSGSEADALPTTDILDVAVLSRLFDDTTTSYNRFHLDHFLPWTFI
jgi:hypothetical protein